MATPCAQLFLAEDDAARGATGYLVGWNPHSFMCTACAIVPRSAATLDALDAALAALLTRPSFREMSEHCGGAPSVLGVVLPRGADMDVAMRARAETAELWLTVDAGGQHSWPSLRTVHCCGCRHRAPLQLFLFRRGRHDGEWRPRVSIHALWDDALAAHHPSSHPDENAAPGAASSHGMPGTSSLAITLRHVSCSGEWQRALLAALASHAGGKPGGGCRGCCHRMNRAFLRLCLAIMAPCLLVLRALAAASLHLLRLESLPLLSPCRWSYAARQAEARLLRATHWPHRFRDADATPLWRPGARLERIHTYGELTCGVIDAALGCCLAAALVHWRVEICALAGATQMAVHEEWLPGLVHWLMGVDPGGFKLNENLNAALGGCVLAMLRAWHGALASILSLLPPPPSMYLLTLVPGTCLGASVGVAIASDVLAFSCVHLLVLHRAIATLYAAYLSALYSLFNLFRGTKYNVLRQRVDSCDYDTEQLLLGTLFFTVLVFLFPTVGAYCVLSTILWLAVLAIQSVLMALLLLLEDFPWFELLQFVVAPGSLHSGVRFRPLPPPAAAKTAAAHATTEAATACFVLEPPLASLGPCFARHRSVGATLLDHGSAGSLLSCLLLGRDLLPSPAREVLLERPPRRSQDRSLAARQRTLSEFWWLLKEAVLGSSQPATTAASSMAKSKDA